MYVKSSFAFMNYGLLSETRNRTRPITSFRPKLPQLKSSKLLIRLADWKIVAVRYWLHFDGDIEE